MHLSPHSHRPRSVTRRFAPRRARALAVALPMVLLLGAGCAEDLRNDTGSNHAVNNGPEPPDRSYDNVTHRTHDDWVVTVVDARDNDTPVLLDLIDGAQIDIAERDSDAWHLAFQRFTILLNGGVSGPGAVALQILDDADFEALDQAPAGDYVTDVEGEPDERGQNPGLAFQLEGAWYDYDMNTHGLTPRERVYVLALDAQHYVKLEFLDYYDAAGTSGFVTFRWAPIASPDGTPPGPLPTNNGQNNGSNNGQNNGSNNGQNNGSNNGQNNGANNGSNNGQNNGHELEPGTFTVDATSQTDWAYVSLRDGATIEVSDASTDHTWDLAIRRSAFRLNGGVSGPGLAAARALDRDAEFDAVESTDHFGFFSDVMLAPAFPPGAEPAPANPALETWFDYDMNTHAVTPAPGVFVVRLADGSYGKLQIVSYESGRYVLRFDTLEAEASTRTLSVDASSSTDWTAISLTHGVVIGEEDTDRIAWDIAIQRTSIRANGGTSGDRNLAAAFVADLELSELATAPADGYAEDEELTAPGPGGNTYSGNPVLSDWYDYDMTTHAVSPRPGVFVVRLDDGGHAALTIDTYDAGAYTLTLAYTGPNSDSFE